MQDFEDIIRGFWGVILLSNVVSNNFHLRDIYRYKENRTCKMLTLYVLRLLKFLYYQLPYSNSLIVHCFTFNTDRKQWSLFSSYGLYKQSCLKYGRNMVQLYKEMLCWRNLWLYRSACAGDNAELVAIETQEDQHAVSEIAYSYHANVWLGIKFINVCTIYV
jgi:hypothetical protein